MSGQADPVPLKGTAKATHIESIHKALVARLPHARPPLSVSELVVEGRNQRMKIPIKATHNNFSSVVQANPSFRRTGKPASDLPAKHPRQPSRSASIIKSKAPSARVFPNLPPSRSVPKAGLSPSMRKPSPLPIHPPPRLTTPRATSRPISSAPKISRQTSRTHTALPLLLRTLRRVIVRKLAVAFTRLTLRRRVTPDARAVAALPQPILRYPDSPTTKVPMESLPELDVSCSGELHSDFSKTFVKFGSDSAGALIPDRLEVAEPFSQDKFREFFAEGIQRSDLDVRADQFRVFGAKR